MKISALALSALIAGSLVSAASAQTGYGITANGNIVSFAAATPGTFNSNVAISGLAASETALSIDARASDGSLVILTSASRMYTVNGATGVATALGSTSAFTPALGNGGYSIDFNPTVDRIRTVGGPAGDENFRLNPVNGTRVAGDTNLTFSSGGGVSAVGVAYTNAQFGVTAALGSIREYVIFSGTFGTLNLGEVGSQAGGNASFNGGIVTIVGGLGLAGTTSDVGFDIFGPTGIAYVSTIGGIGAVTNNLYTINLATGAATLVGAFDPSGRVTDITFIPAPSAAAVMGLGLIAAARRRR
ncbi:hypothetical protein BH11PLA1_BH11PLA1_06510 [soil metagenome]